MNVGRFSLPAGVVVFFVSVMVALAVGRFAGKKRVDVETEIFLIVLIGLIAARLFFVLRYLPGYGGDLLKMADFRDLGFDPMAGFVAGVIASVWMIVRRRHLRTTLLVAGMCGLVVWFGGSALLNHGAQSARVPGVVLTNADGASEAVFRNNGKPLVVNLWATWCGPCQDEMPVLANFQNQNRNVELVFVNQGESPARVHTFLERLNLHIANSLFDPDLSVAKATGVTGYPTTLFYDASGRLVSSHLGRLSAASLDAEVTRLTEASAATTSRDH